MNELTRALFEAHVAHELSTQAVRHERAELARVTESLFEWLETVQLNDILTRAQVLGVIDRYVIELRISGGIAELAGQMSQVGFTSDVCADTRLDQLLSDEGYRGFADKIQSLQPAYERLIQLLTRTPSLRPLLARAIATAASKLLFDWSESQTAVPRPLAQLGQKLQSGLSERIEQGLNHYLAQHRERVTELIETNWRALLDLDTVRTLADELWESVAGMRLAELFSFLSGGDIEDFVVLGYETWLKFRRTPYFRDLSEQMVDAFFAKYGAESVQALLDDMGVNEAMVTNELHTLFVPMIDHAARTGLLESRLRARLLPFYDSPAVAALLDDK